jgi:hypothetical protein
MVVGMKAKHISKLMPCKYNNDELAWVMQLIARAALNDDSEITLEFSWDRYDKLPRLDLIELGYEIYLDHPLRPEIITISGWD